VGRFEVLGQVERGVIGVETCRPGRRNGAQPNQETGCPDDVGIAQSGMAAILASGVKMPVLK
jgi:hypothetical protein